MDLDDLNSRAGPHRWGLPNPARRPGNSSRRPIEPFLEDMEQNRELWLKADALEICKGMVFALYRLRKETNNGVLGWAPDFLGEAAGWAVDRWCASGRRKKVTKMSRQQHPVFPKEFVDEFVPEWNDFLVRVAQKT